MLTLPLCCGRDQAFVGEILEMSGRFGTEGSVVRIHSPRPKIPNEFERSVCGVTRFHFGNRVTGRLNPTFAPLYTQTVGFSGDCCHSTVVSRPLNGYPEATRTPGGKWQSGVGSGPGGRGFESRLPDHHSLANNAEVRRCSMTTESPARRE